MRDLFLQQYEIYFTLVRAVFRFIHIKQQLLSLTCISNDHDGYLPLREVIVDSLVQSRYVLQSRASQNLVVRVASFPGHVIPPHSLGTRLVTMYSNSMVELVSEQISSEDYDCE